MDAEGYPTDAELDQIAAWPYQDAEGWFAFIKERWHLADWGWSKGAVNDEDDHSTGNTHLFISTAGWSGNESIIEAMQKNRMLWMLTWYSSRRGGHYEFRWRPL